MLQNDSQRVFISYHRADSAGWAARIYDLLAARLGSSHLWMDVNDIAPGQDFTRAIWDAIALADVVVVLIGQNWQRRASQELDLVSNEVAVALEQERYVIPVVVDDATMPLPSELPAQLRPLASRQYLHVRRKTADKDLGQLVSAITRALDLRHSGTTTSLPSRPLLKVRAFLDLAGVSTRQQGDQSLTVVYAPPPLLAYTPFPLRIASPASLEREQDLLHLRDEAATLASSQSATVGMLVYDSPPDAVTRLRLAELRLTDEFMAIPVPLSSIEATLTTETGAGALLREWAERYLPGANIFDDRNAVSDAVAFFGRTELLGRLQDEVLAGEAVGIFGIRKSGKTSVLLQLERLLNRHPMVHVDLQRFTNSATFKADVFSTIVRELRMQVGENDIYEPPKSMSAEQFATQLEEFSREADSRGFRPPIILVFDELERVFPSTDPDTSRAADFVAVFGALRSLAQRDRLVSLVLADVYPDVNRINRFGGGPTNPMFQLIKEIHLQPFSQAATVDMLRDLARFMGRTIDEDVAIQIHTLSGGHPFVSRQLASILHEGTTSARISMASARELLDRVVETSQRIRSYLIENVWLEIYERAAPAEGLVLLVLAFNSDGLQGVSMEDLARATENHVSRLGLVDGLARLSERGLVRTRGDDVSAIMPILLDAVRMWATPSVAREWRLGDG